jgi:hypothetical protein
VLEIPSTGSEAETFDFFRAEVRLEDAAGFSETENSDSLVSPPLKSDSSEEVSTRRRFEAAIAKLKEERGRAVLKPERSPKCTLLAYRMSVHEGSRQNKAQCKSCM